MYPFAVVALLLATVGGPAIAGQEANPLRVRVFDAKCTTSAPDCKSPLFEETREAIAKAGVVLTGTEPAENPRRGHELWYTAGNEDAAEKLWKDHLAGPLGKKHKGGEWKWGGDFDVAVIVGGVAIAHRGVWPPRFSDYRARGKPRKGRMAINYASTPDAKKFHTRLTKAMAEGPDFAGYCKVVTWGCGSACETGYVINLKRGALYELPSNSAGLGYQSDSRLLVANPPAKVQEVYGDNPPDYVVTGYFVLEDDGLVPLEKKDGGG